ncbi:MAG: restriction endonuclease [Pseudomonadota bacterium]
MRIPSFNDFSPGILSKAFGSPDLRKVLRAVSDNEGNKEATAKRWADELFAGAQNKRSTTNVPATLNSTGLLDTKEWVLTTDGRKILGADSEAEAISEFARLLLTRLNGMEIVDAIRSLNLRAEQVTKASLKQELLANGIEGLSTATTDHTTHQNWLVEAGVLSPKKLNFLPIDDALKALAGISASERADFLSLTLAQQVFLSVLRRLVETEASKELPVSLIYAECARDYRDHFDDSQISAKVLQPLEQDGWITLSNRTGKASGGKSGVATATAKLLDILMSEVLPNFDAVIPADLRAKRDTPRDVILRMLNDSSKNERGVGLELLALRMLVDLGLEPRSFRLRTKETAYAELDLTAEGAHLTFSRWNIQCKCIKNNVSLGDIAKEVGLAIYSRAHVVAIVTTSGFSREALNYTREITQSTHLQFVLIDQVAVEDYLTRGASTLVDFVMSNAKNVMALKRAQPIDADSA